MKLLTKELLKIIPKPYSSENISLENKMVYAKFFTPWTIWTWYVCEYNPEDRTFFGFVEGFEGEWGYFALEELESIEHFSGLKVERDIFFKPCKFSEIKDLATI